MPVLSEILSSIKAHGSIYFCDKLDPPWHMEEKLRYAAAFHYVRSGRCWLGFDGNHTLLGPGDLVFIGRGDDHSLSSYRQSPDDGDYDDETHLLCGYFGFRDPIPEPLAQTMPPVLVIPSEQISQMNWLRTTLEHLSSEYQAQTPGADVVVNKLTEVVLVELIRHHINSDQNHNFIAALADKQIGEALRLIHGQPEKHWTLDVLADSVAMSRAAFAKRFKLLVGQSMLQYLTSVRMRRACELLRHSTQSMFEIAEQVGYASDLAFSKVFKAQFDVTPSAWRKRYKESMATESAD